MGSSSLVLQEAQSGISSGAKIPAKRSALKPYGQIWGRFPTSNMCQLRGLGAPNRLVGQCGPPVSAPDGPTSAAEKAAWKHSHLTLQIDWNPVVNISHKIRTIRAAVQRRCAPTRSGCKYSMRLQLSSEASSVVPLFETAFCYASLQARGKHPFCHKLHRQSTVEHECSKVMNTFIYEQVLGRLRAFFRF